MTVHETRTLTIEPATPGSIAQYGELIGISPSRKGSESLFYEGTVNYLFGGFSSDADTTLIVSRTQPRDLSVRYMERHFKHTQTFIPLAGKPFVMVLAPPTEGDLPDLDDVAALEFDGSAGFMLHIGTWHEFPFALRRDTDLVSVLRNETFRGVSSRNADDGESHNPDLDKKDIVARLGIELKAGFGAPQTEFS